MISKVTLFIIALPLVLWYLKRYIRNILYIRKFITPPMPALPLIGHAYLGLFIKPEDLLTMMFYYFNQDVEKRKAGAMLGEWPVIICTHPETIEPILNSNIHISKSPEYDPVRPWLGRGLLLNAGEGWRKRRKMLTPAFHFKILEDSMPIFNRNTDKLLDVLDRSEEESVDIWPVITRFTLDIILQAAMGKTLSIQDEKDCVYAESIAEIVHLIQVRQISPWLQPDWIFNISPAGRKFNECLEVLHGFTRKVLEERKRENRSPSTKEAKQKKTVNFLDLIMSESQLTDRDIQEEVDTFMFRGHDTTASAISWFLFLIANNPAEQEKLYLEQKQIFGDDDRDVEQPDLSKMKYLDCCVKEALRLYPSVPVIGRSVDVDDDNLRIDGVKIEKGSTLIILTYLLHRNERVWRSPDKFLPERFLPGSPLEEPVRHPFAFIPFSAGPRNCIGQRFALMEEKTCLSRLIRKFKVQSETKIEDIKPVIEVITKPNRPVLMRFIHRH